YFSEYYSVNVIIDSRVVQPKQEPLPTTPYGVPGTVPGAPGAFPGAPGAFPGAPGAFPGAPGAFPGAPGAFPGAPRPGGIGISRGASRRDEEDEPGLGISSGFPSQF